MSNDELDPLEIFGDVEAMPDFDPEEEFVNDKYGKTLPRCHRIKNDGTRCKSYAYVSKRNNVQSKFCKMHGGPGIEARAELGQLPHQVVLPFKEHFDKRFDEYLRALRNGKFRYSIDREIAALKAMDDYSDEIMRAIDAPNIKDIERSVRMKERVAALIEKMTDIEIKRASKVTSNTMKIMLQEMITTVRAEIKSPREQARLLRAFREVFSPNRLILEDPVEDIENERNSATFYLDEGTNEGFIDV